MIIIVDYGVGNLQSISNMIRKVGGEAKISNIEQDLLVATKLVLPGVGAFDTCASKLASSGLLPILNKKVLQEKVPTLGVCVGMQLLLEGSEEGVLPGLGWIKGTVVKFKQDQLPIGFKVPHIGWTDVALAKTSTLFEDIIDPRFYFVHSYHAHLTNEEDALVYAHYGYRFVAGVERENIMGVQFHPEKSHTFGMKLLENFARYRK